MNSELNINNIRKLFSDSSEGIIVISDEDNILSMNSAFIRLVGNISDIEDIEHLFSFDVGILDEKQYLTYNPIRAAITSKESFKCEALCEISQHIYINVLIRSFKFSGATIICINDLSEERENVRLRKDFSVMSKQIDQLKSENEQYSSLKENAESQAVRIGLIHSISTSIRDTLDINEVISKAISEISQTLGVSIGAYANFDVVKNKFSIRELWNTSPNSCVDEKILLAGLKTEDEINILKIEDSNGIERLKLLCPVKHRNDLLGLIILIQSGTKREWHREEISLIEGIAAQLGAAIYQASLFNRLEVQKDELEKTLNKLKDTQTQLIQSEKMASLGQLVAGVAHEINTPLGAVNSNISVIKKCSDKIKENINNQDIQGILDILDNTNNVNSEAVARINRIVKALKNFARLDEAEYSIVDLHEGLRSTLLLIRHELKDHIQIVENYGELPLVECYPNLLNQVFMNILVNACQSIENTGFITITTSCDNDNAIIKIEDTGKGIPENILNKIFDPGFTTKGAGIGTGLGLSICYQIIEKHSGKILVDSTAGTGTTFTIKLPLKNKCKI